MPQVSGAGIPRVQQAPDFWEQLSSCLVALENRSFLPTLHSQLLRAGGRWHQFVYPWMLFWEERDLCASIFSPWTETWGGGRVGTSVSFYCFYLSSYLRRFFYFLSLNPKQKKKKKKFCTITHYYFQKKNMLPKKFRMERNLQKCPLIAGVFHLIPGGYSQ